jgi:LPXTG-site transpeptidase (sortase) family protein
VILVVACSGGASELRASELPAASFETVFIAPAYAPTEMPSAAIPSGYRVSLPRLGIDLPIAEGDVKRDIDDQRTPESFAFHLPGTALPGQNGNVYLYAHARDGMFLALWSVRPGDEVIISASDRVLVYVVRDILPRVAPTDVSSTQPTTTERLTLQTSTGPWPSDPRFVVFAFPRGQ